MSVYSGLRLPQAPKTYDRRDQDRTRTMIEDGVREAINSLATAASTGSVFIPATASTTVLASAFKGATPAAQINAAIAYALLKGYAFVYVPTSLTPYDASAVSFNTAVHMITEGASWGNVWDVGAYGGGGSDDKYAWAAALAGAGAAGTSTTPAGVVQFRGVSLISATQTVPAGVSVWGNAGILRATGSAFGPMLTVDGTSFGNRFGSMRDFQIDGHAIATIGLDVGLAVERDFSNLRITGCTSIGLKVRGAQNCTLVSVNCEDNGTTGTYDTNCLLDLGTGNCAFVRCEFTATTGMANEGKYNLLVRQSGASPTGAYPNGPEGNAFYRCIIERSSTTHAAQVYQRAGRFNFFHNCTISTDGVAIPAVKLDTGDVSGSIWSEFAVFRDCQLSGGTGATAFSLASFVPLVVSNVLLESFTTGFAIDDSSFVDVQGRLDGAPSTLFSATGAKNLSQLVSTARITTLAQDGSGTPESTFAGSEFYNPSTQRRWVWDGAQWCYAQYGTTSALPLVGPVIVGPDPLSGSTDLVRVGSGITTGNAGSGSVHFTVAGTLTGRIIVDGTPEMRIGFGSPITDSLLLTTAALSPDAASGLTLGTASLPWGAATVGAFGCNGATAQTAYASGGALAAYGTGAFGLDSGAHMQALYNLVVAMRAALVANGIMS